MYLQLAQHDVEAVLRTSDRALDVFPNQGNIYYLRGVALASKQDYDAASGSLQQALIMAGRNNDLMFRVLEMLGSVYLETGQREKAYDAFTKALKIKPQDVSTLNKYAYALVMNHESLDLASDMALKVIQVSPGNASAEHILALIYYLRGDLKTARVYIEQCMDHGGGDQYKALETYGDILFTMGETETAVEHWQLSLGQGNPSEILKRKIAERRIIH